MSDVRSVGSVGGLIIKAVRSLGYSRPASSAKRPTDIVYGVDDVPPAVVILFGGLQHVALISVSLIVPLTLFKEAGLAPAAEANLLSLALIALGLASLLQAIPVGPIGSGLLGFDGPEIAAPPAGLIPMLPLM